MKCAELLTTLNEYVDGTVDPAMATLTTSFTTASNADRLPGGLPMPG
jgi:hypothetical protein